MNHINKKKPGILSKRGRPQRDQVWIWGAVVEGTSDQYFFFRILEHPSDAFEGKPRGKQEMLQNLHMLGIPKGSVIVSDCWKGTKAAVKQFRLDKGWSDNDLKHESVNHSAGEIVNVNGKSSNAIEARWSVLKRWIREQHGGRMPTRSNRQQWKTLISEFSFRKLMSRNTSLDFGNTHILALKDFVKVAAAHFDEQVACIQLIVELSNDRYLDFWHLEEQAMKVTTVHFS